MVYHFIYRKFPLKKIRIICLKVTIIRSVDVQFSNLLTAIMDSCYEINFTTKHADCKIRPNTHQLCPQHASELPLFMEI